MKLNIHWCVQEWPLFESKNLTAMHIAALIEELACITELMKNPYIDNALSIRTQSPERSWRSLVRSF